MGTSHFGNDHFAAITGYGDYVQCNIIICHVYYVECLGHNLFNVGQFCYGDLEVAFRSKTCYVQNLEGDNLLTGDRESNLYTISHSDMVASLPVCLMSKATSTKSWLWHRRLSHLNFGTINDLTKHDLVDGLPKFKYDKDHLCSACERGKSKKASHPPKLVPSSHSKLELLHMDLCGPMRVASINGKKYILVIVDDYSRSTWVYFLHIKDETPNIIKKFIAQVQLNYDAKIHKIRTHNGTEFKNATLKAHYEKLGIMQQFSTARTPQQNGIVKRHNRTLVEKVEVSNRSHNKPDVESKNVALDKKFVTNDDIKNALIAKNVLCVTCAKNVLIPCHDNCLAKYKFNVHSNVRRALFTTPRIVKSTFKDTTLVVSKTRFSVKIAQSKSLDTTPVVSKTKIAAVTPLSAKNKVVQIVLWIVDSGCSKHMTSASSLLKNFVEKFTGTVRFGNDHFAAITGYGDYVQGNITICHVYYVEGLGHNLFSVGQFCDGDLEVAFCLKTYYVRNFKRDDLLIGDHESNLYTISISDMAASSLVCLMSKATLTKSWLWYHRLSHLNFGTINDLTKHDLVVGLLKFKYDKDHLCSVCDRGKRKKASHLPKLVPSSHSKLELLHMDLCGPMRVASINGKTYILLNYDAKIYKILTDNGTEFKNATLKDHYEKLDNMANENVPVPAPIRSDDQILPFVAWVPIGKRNFVLDLQKKQKNPFWNTLTYKAKNGAYSFQLDENCFILDTNLLRLYKGNSLFVNNGGEDDEVFRMQIPKELITNNIRNAPYYNAYLEMITKYDQKTAAEEGGKKKSATKADKSKKPATTKQLKLKPVKEKSSKSTPTPKPKVTQAKPAKPSPAMHPKRGKVQKIRKGKSFLQHIDEDEPTQPETEPEPEHQGEGEEYDIERAIKMSLESF
ncbi:retrovirus-related pol polyprotein from transposon TNT 1-94 [Tanacetum coccineum]